MSRTNIERIARLICYEKCRAGICKDDEKCHNSYPGESDPCFLDYIRQAENLCAGATRVNELEAERDALKELVSVAQRHAAEFARQANAMKNERDAIRPTTIEECGKLALAYEHPNVAKVRDSGSQWLAGHDGACLGISAVIRALNQPAKPSAESE